MSLLRPLLPKHGRDVRTHKHLGTRLAWAIVGPVPHVLARIAHSGGVAGIWAF
jgi:hypothetical protein